MGLGGHLLQLPPQGVNRELLGANSPRRADGSGAGCDRSLGGATCCD
jgi:hypothetical protein